MASATVVGMRAAARGLLAAEGAPDLPVQGCPVVGWEVEPEHQDYLERRPDGYSCHFVWPDWKLPARSSAAQHA